jgi:hypothetical protein
MSALRLIAALVTAAACVPAFAQDGALRLEMLAERIAKLHAQVGLGVLADRGRRALPEAMREFDSGLRDAKARATGAELRDNYVLLGLLWTDYRAWASKPPTRDNAKKIAERAEEVAWIAAKGARLMYESGRKGTGLLALDAARAATLSQRLARLYLMQRWGVKQESSGREIPAVAADLQRTLEKLRAAPQNTPEIVTELQAAEGQMGFLLQAGRELEGKRANARALEFIAKSGDHLLDSMERLVRLYEGG